MNLLTLSTPFLLIHLSQSIPRSQEHSRESGESDEKLEDSLHVAKEIIERFYEKNKFTGIPSAAYSALSDFRERAFPAFVMEELVHRIERADISRAHEKICRKRKKCLPSALRTRSFDGSCNNIVHNEWGSAGNALQRGLPAHYQDGIGAPFLLPPPVYVASALFFSYPSPSSIFSLLLPHFFRFVYNDIVSLPSFLQVPDKNRDCHQSSEGKLHPECISLSAEERYSNHNAVLRTLPACSWKERFQQGVREQMNGVSSYLDAGSVYDSPEVGSQIHERGWSPKDGFDENDAFDFIFSHQHNQLVRLLKRQNPTWTSSDAFSEARRIVIGRLQHVVYSELLPTLLGHKTMDEYDLHDGKERNQYDAKVDATSTDEFAGAAGLVFKTMMMPSNHVWGEAHIQEIPHTPSFVSPFSTPSDSFKSTQTAFRSSSSASTPSYSLNIFAEKAVKQIRSLASSASALPGLHYSQATGPFGTREEIAEAIARGRDHGLRAYSEWRFLCTGEKVSSFSEMADIFTGGRKMAKKLEKVYSTPSKADLFVVGLAEKPLRGSLFGVTLTCLIAMQFQKTKWGDRFWYTNDVAGNGFSEEQLAEIRKTTLASLICESMIEYEDGVGVEIQPNPLLLPDNYDNAPVACSTLLAVSSFSTAPWSLPPGLVESSSSTQSSLLQEAIRYGKLRAVEQISYEAGNIQRNQGEWPVGDPVVHYGAFMKPKQHAVQRSEMSVVFLHATKWLMSHPSYNSSLRGHSPHPLEHLLMAHVDARQFISNVSFLLGGASPDACIPQTLPCDPTSAFRTFSGWCNNLRRPSMGNAFEPMLHLLPPVYQDGIEAPREFGKSGQPLPNPRHISNKLHKDIHAEHEKYTHMLQQFGQFVTHEITHAPVTRGPQQEVLNCSRCDSASTISSACLPIPIPEDDPFFPAWVGDEKKCLPLTRSLPGQLCLGPRNQINQLTAFIDASVVYGSTKCEANALRAFRGGLMNYTNLGPYNVETLPQSDAAEDCESFPRYPCFLAGDNRNSLQPLLLVLHTTMLREHNRIAERMSLINPHWDDERIYQETRRIVGALLAHFTYSEYLPKVLGWQKMQEFDLLPKKTGYFRAINLVRPIQGVELREKRETGYDASCDASISHPFAVAAFRFGHSMVRRQLHRLDENFENLTSPVDLAQNFNNARAVYDARGGSTDSLLLGMVGSAAMAVDRYKSSAVRNYLFSKPGDPGSGMDLAAINILRGREHGLQSYNDIRELCFGARAHSFSSLSALIPESNTVILENLYDDVDDIDLFSGILSEKADKGILVPPTAACIIADQFARLKKCDRFFYENDGTDTKFTLDQLEEIRRQSLAALFCRNSRVIRKMQPDVFILPDDNLNSPIPCSQYPIINLNKWKEAGSCSFGDTSISLHASIRPSPCQSCVCTRLGMRCQSIIVTNCDSINNIAYSEKARNDPSCLVQCSNSFT